MYKGSALILTILLITAISTMLFSVARLTYSDLAQATRLEESINANYAAESGVEVGLLAYRFNHEAETSANATVDSGNPMTFNLASASVPSASTPSATMRMWWKAGNLGNVPNVRSDNGEGSPKLLKDQTIELDLTNLAGQDLTFYWTNAKIAKTNNSCPIGDPDPVNPNDCIYPQVKPMDCLDENNQSDDKCYFLDTMQPIRVQGPYGLEFTLSTIDQNGVATPCDKYLSPTSGLAINNNPYNDLDNNLSWSCADGHGNDSLKYKLRIKPLIGILDAPDRANDQPYVYYAVSGNSPTPIDNGTTHIESIGSYGATRRTITIDLNRSSTRLMGLYDFILAGLGGDVTGSTASPSPTPTP